MREIEKYISKVMARRGVPSYRQLSLQLGMSVNEIQQIMSKGVTPSDDLCIKLAKFAGDDPEMVLLLAAQSKAPKESQKFWADIFQKVSKVSNFSFIFLFFFLSVAFSPTPSLSSEVRRTDDGNIHYATRLGTLIIFLKRIGTRIATIITHLTFRMGCRYAGASCP